jgi:glycosyltransferase involved in cell wall biosynthesis
MTSQPSLISDHSDQKLVIENPLVTVVIPTFNRLNFLQQAIHSVVHQTYKNWELFIVDDGSTDGTVEMIRLISDKRVHLLELPHCGNIAALRNAGANAGSGEWIAFLDSDDIWISEKLEIQLQSLHEKKKRWGYGCFALMNESGDIIPNRSGTYRSISGWITKQILTTEASVYIGSLMVERKLFNELSGFDIDPLLTFREDYEFTLQLSLREEAIAIPDLLIKVRDHSKRSTNCIDDGLERTAFAYYKFLKNKPGNELKKIAHRKRGYHLAESSVKKIMQGKYFHAIKLIKKAFVNGDRIGHLLSVIRRGIHARYKFLKQKKN